MEAEFEPVTGGLLGVSGDRWTSQSPPLFHLSHILASRTRYNRWEADWREAHSAHTHYLGVMVVAFSLQHTPVRREDSMYLIARGWELQFSSRRAIPALERRFISLV